MAAKLLIKPHSGQHRRPTTSPIGRSGGHVAAGGRGGAGAPPVGEGDGRGAGRDGFANTVRGLAAFWVVVATGGIAPTLWMNRKAEGRCYRRASEVPPVQAAVVLGARVQSDGTPSTALEDRLLAALELYEAGVVRRLLVTGNAQAPEHDEPAAMARWLRARNVRDEDIVADPGGRRTIDSMRRAACVYGIRSAVICTQQFHLPRALFLADRAGIESVGLACDLWYRPRARDHGREAVAQLRAFVEGFVR